jgi:long-chain acyl-CoA synthetase
MHGTHARPEYLAAFVEEFAEIFESVDESLGPQAGPLLAEAVRATHDEERVRAWTLLSEGAASVAAGASLLAVDDPALRKALTSRLNRRLQCRPGARPDERLAGVALVEPFSIENGLLTQTLKQRRDRIAARDSSAIDAIYAR